MNGPEYIDTASAMADGEYVTLNIDDLFSRCSLQFQMGPALARKLATDLVEAADATMSEERAA